VVLKTLESPWTARRSNQAILKEISPAYSLEGLMLKPKLPYSGYLMRRTDSLEKTLMLGKIEGRKRREQHWTSTAGAQLSEAPALEAEGEETQCRGRPIVLETGTTKTELSTKLTRPSLRFQKTSS